MSIFYRRILLFVSIPLALVFMVFLFLYRFNYQLLSKYKISPKINTLIIGDSRIAYAFNDQILLNTLNISQTSEGYIYSFPILQGVLKNNPQIKTVILGCSYSSISSYYDNNMFVPHISARYFYVSPFDIQIEVLKKNKGNLFLLLRKIITNGVRNLITQPNKYTFIGKYETYSTNKPLTKNSIEKRIASQYYENGNLVNFAAINSFYLLKIADLCKTNNVRLVLVNTPMHNYYLSNVPIQYKERFYSLINNNKLELIEFNNLVLGDSCFLPDGDHLTKSGATLTTNYLKEILDNSTKLNNRAN